MAIAGVIVTRPEILVLDEPAAGLDPKGKKEFLELLHDLHKRFVKTVVFVSHDMNLVAEHCTRAAIFSHGKIHAEGTPKELFTKIDDLTCMGLDKPVTAMLESKLKEVGLSVDSDLTVDDFIENFMKKYTEEVL